MRPFIECHHIPGAFSGACANCKWPDLAHQCSVQDELWHDLGQERLVGPNRPHGCRPALRTVLTIEDGTAKNPIKLEPEEGDSGSPIVLDGEEGSADNPIVL